MRFIKNSLTFLLIISCLFCCASTLKRIKTSGFTPSNTLFLAGAFGSSDYHGNTNSKEADLRQQASQGFDTAGSIPGQAERADTFCKSPESPQESGIHGSHYPVPAGPAHRRKPR